MLLLLRRKKHPNFSSRLNSIENRNLGEGQMRHISDWQVFERFGLAPPNWRQAGYGMNTYLIAPAACHEIAPCINGSIRR